MTPNKLIRLLKIVAKYGYGDRRLDCYYNMAVIAGLEVTEDSKLGKRLLKEGVYLHDKVGWCVPL